MRPKEVPEMITATCIFNNQGTTNRYSYIKKSTPEIRTPRLGDFKLPQPYLAK